MFKKLLLTILLLTPFYFFASFTLIHAEEESVADQLNKIYCQRRQGNQLNLETWYGGRCTSKEDELEQSIGFGDIILLDLYSRIVGESDSEYYDTLKLFIEGAFKGQTGSLPEIETQANKNSGALPSLGYAISKVYQTPPASSVEYIADIKSNFIKNKPVQEAYAQNAGFGFSALNPIIKIWRNFRNLAYLVFILAFIYYGFMIMFRMKINPQTVMNIQLAIPKLIITLLLITFSYAIAGLLIDIFYVVVGFIFSAFAAGEIVSDVKSAQLWSGFSWGWGLPLVYTFAHLLFGGLSQKIILAVIYIPNWLGGSITTGVLTAGLSLIVVIILAIALLYTFFKILWMLLKSYVTILLQIIFSPIILLGNVLPGSTAFSSWVRNIFAELSIFGTILALFLLAFYFIGPFSPSVPGVPIISLPNIGPNSSNEQIWMPPPLSADNSTENTKEKLALLGVGLILIAPSIAKSIRDALKVKEAGYGTTIGDALKYSIGAPTSIYGAYQHHTGATGKADQGAAINTLLGGLFGYNPNLPQKK